MSIDEAMTAPVRERLERLYGDRADDCLRRLNVVLEKYADLPEADSSGWDQRDIVLITYGDQIRHEDDAPLATLSSFLTSAGLHELLNTVHILPFNPYSSDDGFSVIDYRQVDPALGDWSDMEELGSHVQLMFDLVLNHVSQHSEWFQNYLRGVPPHDRFFHEVAPETDVSRVTRPRSLPLLTAFDTTRGRRHVWTTFSDDQVDLNFAEPDVLFEMIDILLFYVREGARIIRLDAIAYLWKDLGTSCIHLDQTHEVVKLMRDILDRLAPHVLLLTETNVPHDENVSYFGNGDEAHMVYQFSLPPLLLDALLHHDVEPLRRWMDSLDETPPGTTFFNFTASHDGVGVRPLEGLVSHDRFERLVEEVRARGGLVGTKRNADGSDSPYELNIAYFDALGDPDGIDRRTHVDRFLASQAIMLALRGIPGVYFHSLVGTPNDEAAAESSGIPRRINRRKYELEELRAAISDPESAQAMVFQGYQHLLATRTGQPAFHPDGAQHVLETGDEAVLAFARTSVDAEQRILVVANVSDSPRKIHLEAQTGLRIERNLLTDRQVTDPEVALEPYQVAWFETAL